MLILGTISSETLSLNHVIVQASVLRLKLHGSGLGQDLRRTRPADILASNWLYGKPAAFDLNMTSPAKPFCYFGSRCHSRISSNSRRA